MVRKQIVATTEGGAITGEERLREHTDQLYGAILSWEGKPGDYQIAQIDALRKELGDATRDFENLLAKDLPALNDALKAKGKEPIPAPPAKIAVNEQTFRRREPRSSCVRAGLASEPELETRSAIPRWDSLWKMLSASSMDCIYDER